MVIYLLANNSAVVGKMKKIKLKQEDLLILFNAAIPLGSTIVKKHQNKQLFCRSRNKSHWKKMDWWGKRHLDSSHKTFNEIGILHYFKYQEHQLKMFQKLQQKYPKLKLYDDLKHHKTWTELKTVKGSSQSGFMVYCMMKELYPETEIKLVGFTIRSGINGGHLCLWEWQFWKKNNITII